uniref:Uncharacterized protein n=1 Tax=Trichogramma kaykai TaxID=54128 RepID=A0ABD2XCU8_9HYME
MGKERQKQQQQREIAWDNETLARADVTSSISCGKHRLNTRLVVYISGRVYNVHCFLTLFLGDLMPCIPRRAAAASIMMIYFRDKPKNRRQKVFQGWLKQHNNICTTSGRTTTTTTTTFPSRVVPNEQL